MRGCEFSDNAGHGAELQGAETVEPLVTGCSFMRNRIGLAIGSFQVNLGDLTNASTEDDGRNSFLGNTEYALANWTGWGISAQNCSWGTTDSAEVERIIYDTA